MNSPEAAALPRPPLFAADRPAWRRYGEPLGSAVLAAGMLVVWGLTPLGILFAAVAATLWVISSIDLERRIIPNKIVLPAAAATWVAHVAISPHLAPELTIAAIGSASILFVPAALRPGSVGMGDVKLCLLLGSALGYEVLPALMLGFVATVPVALVLFAARGRAAGGAHIPMGVFLTFGALVILFTGS